MLIHNTFDFIKVFKTDKDIIFVFVCVDFQLKQSNESCVNHMYESLQALAWCPWRKSVIATGGGSSDGHIRLWHIHTGEKLAEIYTKSQVMYNSHYWYYQSVLHSQYILPGSCL